MTNKNTIVGLLLSQAERLGNREAMREKTEGDQWASSSWDDWACRSRAVASALINFGIELEDPVAIFSYSRRQWFEADIGTLMTGACTVTVYHNLTPDSLRYVLSDSKARLVFAEGPIQLKALFDTTCGPPPTVEQIVYFTDCQTPVQLPGDEPQQPLHLDDVIPEEKRAKVVSFESFIDSGNKTLKSNLETIEKRLAALDPELVAKIVYTSGTTGDPKGAMLTHGNLLSVVDSVQEGIRLRPTDVQLLFLPLAHVYGQVAYHSAIKIGMVTAFAESMLTVVDDAAAVKPDFFAAVPRLFEKIHAAALTGVAEAGGLKRQIFDWATDVGCRVSGYRQRREPIPLGLGAKWVLANKLVYQKLKDRLGGRVRYMISGGAPLPQHTMAFFDSAGLQILEGYGMTECAALSHYNRRNSPRFGTVGQIIPGMEQRIAKDGELLLRGPNVMKGYLGKPEATAETIDAEGWLHTGDVVTVDEDGYVTITDRKKEIIVTSGGKNIAPAPIENKLTGGRFISQAVVIGDRRKYLAALLVLDNEYVRIWARENDVTVDPSPQFAQNEQLMSAVQVEVDEVNGRLDSFSTIKKFALLTQEFTIQDGEITPSLKLKRRIISERYQELIDSLYLPLKKSE